jgi:hypothetical protein
MFDIAHCLMYTKMTVCLLGCCTVWLGRSLPTFQRCLLPTALGHPEMSVNFYQTTVHRLRVGKAVGVGEQVALSILLSFLCNISFCLSCAAQTLVLSYQRLLTVVLACVVVVGG